MGAEESKVRESRYDDLINAGYSVINTLFSSIVIKSHKIIAVYNNEQNESGTECMTCSSIPCLVLDDNIDDVCQFLIDMKYEHFDYYLSVVSGRVDNRLRPITAMGNIISDDVIYVEEDSHDNTTLLFCEDIKLINECKLANKYCVDVQPDELDTLQPSRLSEVDTPELTQPSEQRKGELVAIRIFGKRISAEDAIEWIRSVYEKCKIKYIYMNKTLYVDGEYEMAITEEEFTNFMYELQ